MLYGSVCWSFNFKDMLSLRKVLSVCLLACFNVWSICAVQCTDENPVYKACDRWRSTLGVKLSHIEPSFLRQDLSLNMELINSVWLASEFEGSAYQPLLTLSYEITNTIPYLTFDFIVRYSDPGPHIHCLRGGLSWVRHFPRSLSDYQWKQYDYIYTFIKQSW